MISEVPRNCDFRETGYLCQGLKHKPVTYPGSFFDLGLVQWGAPVL